MNYLKKRENPFQYCLRLNTGDNMQRRDAIEKIMNSIDDELVICNIGFPSRELYDIEDRKENFYMIGSMGLASSIGLGLALSQPEKDVVVIDGDGALLMNMGSLVTVKACNPRNLTWIVINNGAYGSTGNQETYAKNLDLKEIAEVEAICFPPAEAATEESIRERLEVYGDHFWLLFEEDKLISWKDRLKSLRLLIPIAVLFGLIIGGSFFGWFPYGVQKRDAAKDRHPSLCSDIHFSFTDPPGPDHPEIRRRRHSFHGRCHAGSELLW